MDFSPVELENTWDGKSMADNIDHPNETGRRRYATKEKITV